ncbi:MAG: HU family DNA-binding protein [Planctomycetota bacterium]|jgi:nucleoid DNA-binding protein|nr:HU family DNA-binding protein [Planctomycetota bacterium]
MTGFSKDNNDVSVTQNKNSVSGLNPHNPESEKSRPGAAAEEVFGRQANKGILSDHVANELNVPRRTAARVLDAVLDSVRDLLKARGKVAVKGFGTFERRIRKGRAYKHPLTGESIEVADKETIMFKPSDQLIADTRTGTVPPRNPNS